MSEIHPRIHRCYSIPLKTIVCREQGPVPKPSKSALRTQAFSFLSVRKKVRPSAGKVEQAGGGKTGKI